MGFVTKARAIIAMWGSIKSLSMIFMVAYFHPGIDSPSEPKMVRTHAHPVIPFFLARESPLNSAYPHLHPTPLGCVRMS